VWFALAHPTYIIPLSFGGFKKFQRRLFIECRLSFVAGLCWFLTSDESNKLQQPQSTLNPPLTSAILKDLCFRLPCWRPRAPCGLCHAAKDLLHVLV